jgi:hypothetical protein
LNDNGAPADGIYDFQFKLFDGANLQQGPTLTRDDVMVAGGAFTLQLDFGEVFDGSARLLEIAVRSGTSAGAFTTLNPPQAVTATPYAIRSLNAANATQLGGLAASEYLTTSGVGNAFIRNDAQQQTANFNLSGNGTIGGTLTTNTVTAQTGTGFYGLTQTDGTTTVSTYVGGSVSGATGAWFGTPSDSPLHFYTNNSQSQLTILQNGNVGIGTFAPQAKLHVAGNAVQERDQGGMIKAMLNVAADGTIIRCYNGLTGSAAGNCGFTVSAGSSGSYAVNLGFQVTDRFLSVVARGINTPLGTTFPPTPMSADYRFSTLPFSDPNVVFIDTFRADNGATANNPFMLIVY